MTHPTPTHDTVVAEVPGAGAARWSIAMGGAIVAVFGALAIASLAGTAVADDGPWTHLILALTMVVALGTGMLAFGLAVAARVQQQTSVLLWLPLLAFPGLVLYLALSDRF